MLATLTALPLFCPAPRWVQAPPERPPAPDSTVEDLEVLRRLLVKAIAPPTPASTGSEDGWLVVRSLPYGPGVPAVAHSRAFRIPQTGAVFTLDVELAVVAVDAGEEPQPPPKDPAELEWERVQREVRTRHKGRWAPEVKVFVDMDDPREYAVDEEALSKVEAAVLETLAKHAGRIQGLAPEEDIWVLVHASGGDMESFVFAHPPEEGVSGAVSWLGRAAAARRAPPRRLAIQASVADLRRPELKQEPARLRELARIHRY